MMVALEARQLTKRYPGGVSALQQFDLEVPRGGVFGLLGPNGAGKSTFLRIVMDLVRPTSGSIGLFGRERTSAALRRVGAFIEGARFPPFFTAREVLAWVALNTGHPAGGEAELLQRVGLSNAMDRRVDGFSLGMKQRLGIATTMIGNPDLIILDEPTNGLDPAGILDIRRLVRELAEVDGTTVLLSSHLLDEVERTCDRVAIVDGGRLIVQGAISDVVGGETRLRVRAEPAHIALSIIGASGRVEGDVIVVAIAEADAPHLIAALCAANVAVFEATWQRQTLESVFLNRVGG
ncbi:ABC transporter ATP-binding protein [Sphingomonas sp. DG1-23]|uniref:ABC transporter ATP-binding protein n=1 Tax=Sphingomonas sp. DG1-23 TaxID=3068316 RepID=UPI00273E7C16|nr:ABC transporter ATP-binding protein [Sphingomonas sp. DG1-23]MDP5279869.1 ABC transporter ATP-binding protein [Sphingomonas sp. DG1-23]